MPITRCCICKVMRKAVVEASSQISCCCSGSRIRRQSSVTAFSRAMGSSRQRGLVAQLGQQNQSVLGHSPLQRHGFKNTAENSKGGHLDEAEQAHAGRVVTWWLLRTGTKTAPAEHCMKGMGGLLVLITMRYAYLRQREEMVRCLGPFCSSVDTMAHVSTFMQSPECLHRQCQPWKPVGTGLITANAWPQASLVW